MVVHIYGRYSTSWKILYVMNYIYIYLRDYIPVHTHKLYNNLQVTHIIYHFTYFLYECVMLALLHNLHTRELIAPLSDILILYMKYLTMHKVHVHAGAIRQLLYGCALHTGG